MLSQKRILMYINKYSYFIKNYDEIFSFLHENCVFKINEASDDFEIALALNEYDIAINKVSSPSRFFAKAIQFSLEGKKSLAFSFLLNGIENLSGIRKTQNLRRELEDLSLEIQS